MKGRFGSVRIAALAIVLLINVVGCGDDGGSTTTGPGGDGKLENPVAAAFAAVHSATQKAIIENADIYQSFGFFGPKILSSTVFAQRIDGEPDKAAQQSCLPSNLQGKIFRYSTSLNQYEPADDPSIPSGNVRFVLYEVDPGGNVLIPLNEIGYLDAECRGQLPTDTLGVTLSTNGVDVLEIELRGYNINPPDFIFGASPVTMRDANGNDVINMLAVASGTAGKYLDEGFDIGAGFEAIDPRLEGLRATAGVRDSLNADGKIEPPFDILTAGANQYLAGGDWWRAVVGMVVEPDGSILNIFRGARAPVEYEDQISGANHNGIYACFSGLYNDPVVQSSASDGGCAAGIIDTPVPLTAEELDAIRQGYLGLVSLLETMTPIWSIALELLTP